MKYIEKLLNGAEVKWMPLGEISTQLNGMSGVSSKWAEQGNCRFIDYLNAYKNIKINVTHLPFATVKKLNQTELKQGDILFTSASETPDECAISSVIESEISSGIFLDDHLFGIRINEKYKDVVTPSFLNYYFRSVEFRKIVNKAVRGVTRFYISKVAFMKLIVPIPALDVQRRIVDILDKFTTLEAELEAELDCRKRQYEYYRNQLLSFDMLKRGGQKLNDVEMMTLGEIAEYSRTRVSSSDVCENTFVGVDNLLQNKRGKTISTHVPTEGNLTAYQMGDVLIGNIRPYLKKIWQADNNGGASGDVLVIHITNEKVMPRYLYQVLADDMFFTYNMQYAKGAKMPRGNKQKIMEYKIPIPSLAEQQRIVSILDKFEALTTSISEGLPKEIELRRKQYEYYRNQLLSFA